MRSVTLAIAALLCACADASAPTDETPPAVVAISPANGATGVTIGSVVTVRFSEPIDPGSLSSNAIELNGFERGQVQGTTTYDASTMTLTFTPAQTLVEKTSYTARLWGTVRDLSGNRLADRDGASVEWEFTTVDNTPPTVYAVSPSRGNTDIQPNATITVRFDEPMDPATVNAATFQVFSAAKGANIAGSVTMADSFNSAATFTPSSPLTAATRYTVTVTTGARDSAGNSLAHEFTSDFVTTPTPDVRAPYVVSTSPSDGDKDANANGVIRVIFSEWIAYSSMTASTFSVRNAVTGETVEGTVAQQLGESPQYWTFTPRFELAKNTRYIATLTTGVRDMAGNPMAQPTSFSFNTAP